ncbi:MAG: potassium channel family protein [Woeseiaceae bacterium]|nr:potassium channel family protein [Woeseiaceae bacterium]
MHTNRFSFLLVALLIFILGVPIAVDVDLVSLKLARILGVTCLLAIGIWSLRGAGRRLFVFGMATVIVGIGLNLASVLHQDNVLHIASMLAILLFVCIAIFNAFRDILIGNEINSNRIVGAVCVYLLLGVIWSILYDVLEFLQPGAFKGLTQSASAAWSPDWLYFSFVTITTLGYGDITPVSQTARSLAFAEAVVGQFYIAILVAGLVSAYISEKQGNSS